jgi:hypothetical protein
VSATGPAVSEAPPGGAAAGACPLCGGDNACAMAAPEGGARECWCFAARIPAETLAQIPEAERGRRCVCARCAGGPPTAVPPN